MKSPKHPLATSVVSIVVLLSMVSMPNAFSAPAPKASPGSAEKKDRTVDAAALSAQKESIARLRTLIRKKQGTSEEAALLERLAEAQQDAAAIEFRVMHGPGTTPKAGADMSAYRSYLRGSIVTLRDLIARFPNVSDPARVQAMLAKAHDEVGEKSQAEREYQLLVTKYPKAPECSAALMALGDMAMAARDYARALRHLSGLEKREDDPRHAFALHRMAWAHYNLKQPGKALSYLERTAEISNDALRELALNDVPVFYLEGREQKLPQYASEQAPSYFKSLDQGPALSRMLIQYAKLLRSKGMAEDLVGFKNILLESQPERPETFEVVTIVLEDQLNHRRFAQLVASAGEIASFKGFQKHEKGREVLEKAQKLLLDSAAEVQKLIAKNKNADGVDKLNKSLADLYAAFTRLVHDKDPRLEKVHHNLAESLFSTRQYETATEHYRWLVSNASGQKARDEAMQKAIASRYEALRAKGLVPKELAAKALSASVSAKLDDSASEWVSWVDARQKSGGGKVNEAFYFEASRMLYASGDVAGAVDRLSGFALQNRTSQYALPSAALVLDTYVASANWAELQKLISEYLAVSEWKGSPLHARLGKLDSEVAYKQLESTYASGDYSRALERAEGYLASHPESKSAGDVLALAGNSAIALKDRSKALKYLSRLIETAPRTEAGAAALLTRGSLEESDFDFPAAARDFQAWLELPDSLKKGTDAKARNALRSRLLTLWWVAGNPAKINQMLRDPQICTERFADTCDRFRALAYLMGSDRSKELTLKAFYRSRKAAAENRPIWAALALEGSRALVFRDRNIALHHLMANWKAVDPLFQTYLVASLSKSIPETFRLNRRGIQEVAPLLLNERYLTYRMEILREFENIAAKCAQLPWARVRAAVLNEVASAYLDVSQGMVRRSQLKNVPIDSARLVMPFEEKGQAIRKNAFEVASNAAVEEEQLDAILSPFMQANPAHAKELKHERVRRPRALEQFALEMLDPENQWRDPARSCQKDKNCLVARFGAATRGAQWSQVAYLILQAHGKKALEESQLGLMRSAAFSAMGAQAEGLKELAAVSSELSRDLRQKSSLYLLVHYFRSLSKQMTKEMLAKFLDSGGSVGGSGPEMTDVASAAAKWIGG